ncbi:MAG: chorismate synthase [Deltaproteobacteria bacterium RIFCSPLOWO2_02_FULL_44_10]|nr:MAG: chorismate synthase [Deltaproteobacteria bacterium RIFCSPHIGHO2_02_FULL_44_16]OGQ46856.1 MAG: chorismate synthase [Deltaproteobacteria bacterium RIFCSPLOWO2_02_FULL_44_10]
MPANSFGQHFRITTFGESHGIALGVVIDGCPAGVLFDETLLHEWMQRRRPGSSSVVSSRNESDIPEILSGMFEGKTLGTPIAIIVRNQDARSEDYQKIKNNPRPGHADDVWQEKFGHADYRGGGRASGRETGARVMAAAIAQMFVQTISPEILIQGVITQIGPLTLTPEEQKNHFTGRVEKFLLQAKEEGKNYGGVVDLTIAGAPKGLGQPVFHKFKSDLASAYMSVGATSAVEIGDGFASASAEGSEFHRRGETESPYGGIRGGITTGEPISVRVAFKPPASVLDVAKKGRHDPCIVPRALPVCEAMTWLVLADHLLWQRLDRII